MLTTILFLTFTFPTFQNPKLEFTISQQHVFFKISNMLREL